MPFGTKKINKQGSILAYALVIMTAVAIILASLVGYIVGQLKYSNAQVQRQEAFEIAEAGIYWYKWYLAHETTGKTAEQINSFWQSTNPSPLGVGTPYQQTFTDPNGNVLGSYSLEVERPNPDSTIVIVKSTGWTNNLPNMKRIVQVRFRRPSWSEYAVLANDVMRFGQGTQIYGKVQSNYGIRVDGTAYNVVSSSCFSYDDPDHSGPQEYCVHTHVIPPPGSGLAYELPSEEPSVNGPVPQNRPDVFKAGRQLTVPTVSFTGVSSDLAFMKTQSQIAGQGLYFGPTGYGWHIVLQPNGTMLVSQVTNYNTSTNAIISQSTPTTYAIPNNGVVFVENNAWVEGTIDNDRLTIAAANLTGRGALANMYIGMNNILYTNTNGQDILGLIGQNNVEVIQPSLNDLTIDAALLAQNGRVGREYYSPVCTSYNRWGWCTSWTNDYKDTITVNGAIATNQRYGFAYTDGTGYANRILNFDNNLLYYPPPYFPTGTEYSIDLWQELQ